MTDIQKTIKELTDIITYLKGKVDSATTYADTTEKTAWEKRINNLATNDATKEISLRGLAAFKDNLAQEITKLIQEKTDLEAAKRQVEQEKDDKQAIITTKEAELAQKEIELQAKINEITGLTEAKLTKDLVDKLNALSADPVNLTAIKNSLDQMTKSLQEVKKEAKHFPISFIYGGFGAIIFSCLLITYQVFFKSNKKVSDLGD